MPIAALLVLPVAAEEPMRICTSHDRNGPAKHCVVDGDTVWFHGQDLRLKDFDTPEPNPSNSKCPSGGTRLEDELAGKASTRLLALLNGNDFTVDVFGKDSTGRRHEATIRIDGRDVGDILIAEGLARHWPDGDTFWCR